MSGGVGPTFNDILLPKEEQQQDHRTSFPNNNANANNPNTNKRKGFITFRQLNALAVMVVLSASGMVSIEDIAFVVFSFIYMYFIFKFAFPILNPSVESTSVFSPNNKLLGPYMLIAAIIGLFLPILYILEGVFEGDKEAIKAAVPHVFLLCGQAFMEGVAFSGRFSTPIGVFVPVFYNSRRIFTIVEWLRSEMSRVDGGSARRLYVGRGLAIANMVLWCFNLFGVLLPVFLPRAFKRYYSAYKVKD